MKQILLHRKKLCAFLVFAILSISQAFAYDVVVAKDGSGDFTTVQAAINAAPSASTVPYTIYIKNGKYKEKINIGKPFIQLIGESVANVVLTYDDYSGKPMPGGGTYGTSNSASVTISGADFAAINITFENTTGESPQALAINITGDRAVFKNCRFLGGQDTIFAGGNGARQYYRNCYIDGTVDFIFGDARAVFDSTIIYPKTRSVAGASYITAANTKQTEPYGYVFRDCKILPNRGGTVYYLGRPWQNDQGQQLSYNKTIFLNTKMGSSVQPAGWSTWDAGTDVNKITYAEYKSRKFDGSLVDISSRVSWSKQLTDSAAAVYYDNTNLFGTWDPCSVYPGVCTNNQPDIAVSNFKGVKGTNTSTFTWNLSWPIAGVKFEVLRSNDKTNFTKISEQTSDNDSLVSFGYTENIPPPGQTYYYLIQASKTGYATQITMDTVAISSTPTINVTGSLGSFLQGVGTPSNPQSYVVSGSSLTNNLVITAPSPFEISADNGVTWNNSSNPIVLTPTANGNIPNTPITVRLNGNTAGTYSGNIVHASVGADTVRLAVSGTIQTAPLTVSQVLQWYPMSINNQDSTAARAVGVQAGTSRLNNLYLSDGLTVPAVPAYSGKYGQAFGASTTGDGSWSTSNGGPGGTLNRNYYEEFVIKPTSTHSLRLDSLILTSSFYNTSSSTKLAIEFSRSSFYYDTATVTGGLASDGSSLPSSANGQFGTPVLLTNETAGTTVTYRFALAGGTGVTLASGDSLTFRLYYSCGSSSPGRYAKLRNVMFKGLATKNPIAGEYRTHQSGNWTDSTTWERFDGTQWITPAPEYPHYSSYGNNGETTTILGGHTVTLSQTLAKGFGYIPRRTKINTGGQLIVSSGVNLNVANDGTPSTATTDLQVDGTLTVLGGMYTNGNVSVLVNGSFVNAATGMNLNNAGDTTIISGTGTYQHNNNSTTNIPGNTTNAFIFQPGATFLVTGLTNAQTSLFRSGVKYYNIVWNNANESAYYAVRNTLDSTNVKGSFTVANTGSTYLSFANSSSHLSFPGGYYQTGGTVNYRESGTVTDTLDLGGDFSVTGGTFNSNASGASTLLLRLNGTGKSITYNQAGATNTNWQVNGSYNLGSNVTIPSAGFGVTLNGTLNTSTYTIGGSGDFTTNAGSILSLGAAGGVNGNITTTGAKSLSTAGSYIFNGSVAQTTGTSLPATVQALTINNASDVSLDGSVNVSAATTLSSGKLLLGNNNLTTTSLVGGSVSKYVVTNGAGSYKINNIGAGNNVFNVGPTTASYNPATINNAGTSDNFSVNVATAFTYPVPDANKVVNRQWTINEDVAGGSNVTLSLSWTAADQAAGFNPASAISIIRYDGTTWVSYPATLTGAGTTANPYVATASGITSFSPFTVINESALPVNLISFTGGYGNNGVNLWWNTTNELNADTYFIERSTNGRTFDNIGSVRAKNSTGNNAYSFADASSIKGLVYYRLMIVDKDGSIKYSKVITMNSSLKGTVSIYPNPAVSNITITHQKANTRASVSIYTMDGKKVLTQPLQVDATQTSVEVSSLPKGSYMVVLLNGERTTMTFMKQ